MTRIQVLYLRSYLEPAISSVHVSAREGFVENSILLGYDAVSMGNQILIFQEND
jgi:hypothetical protein